MATETGEVEQRQAARSFPRTGQSRGEVGLGGARDEQDHSIRSGGMQTAALNAEARDLRLRQEEFEAQGTACSSRSGRRGRARGRGRTEEADHGVLVGDEEVLEAEAHKARAAGGLTPVTRG